MPEEEKSNNELGSEAPSNLERRALDLAAFDKIENAISLIEDAVKQRPALKILQLDPLLKALSDGLRILSSKDTELDLHDLLIKNEWSIGQRFYVNVVVQSARDCSFVTLAGQSIPEGVLISGNLRSPKIHDGEKVELDLEIQRTSRKVAWRIRAIHRL